MKYITSHGRMEGQELDTSSNCRWADHRGQTAKAWAHILLELHEQPEQQEQWREGQACHRSRPCSAREPERHHRGSAGRSLPSGESAVRRQSGQEATQPSHQASEFRRLSGGHQLGFGWSRQGPPQGESATEKSQEARRVKGPCATEGESHSAAAGSFPGRTGGPILHGRREEPERQELEEAGPLRDKSNVRHEEVPTLGNRWAGPGLR